MKKLFSIGLLVIMVVLLSACSAEDETTQSLQDDVEHLQTQVSSLQDILGDKGTTINTLEGDIDSLNEEIATLKAMIYDGSVVFSVEVDDELYLETVHYREREELSAFDLLESAFTIDYTEFDFGNMINSIEDLDAPHGSFLAISKNGESLSVGLSDATYEDGDHFHFERQWFDDTAQTLYEGITLFTSQQLDNYLVDGDVDLNVLAALNYTDFDADVELTDAEDLESAGDFQKGIIKRMIMDEDYDALQDDFASLASTDWLYPASLNVFALQGHESFDDYVSDFLVKVDGIVIEESDHDSLVLAAFALALIDTATTEVHYNDIVSYLTNNPYDFLYGENASSLGLFMMLMAYEEVAFDDESLMQGDQTLLDVFMAYQADNGGFYYTHDDETIDAMFSTPQAFLALSYTYALYSGEEGLPFPVIEQ